MVAWSSQGSIWILKSEKEYISQLQPTWSSVQVSGCPSVQHNEKYVHLVAATPSEFQTRDFFSWQALPCNNKASLKDSFSGCQSGKWISLPSTRQADPCKCSSECLELPLQILLDFYRYLGCRDSSLSLSVCLGSVWHILNITSYVL